MAGLTPSLVEGPGDRMVNATAFEGVQRANRWRTLLLLIAMMALLTAVAWWAAAFLGIGGVGVVPIAVGIAIVTTWLMYWNSHRIVLGMAQAHQIRYEDAPVLFNLVDEVRIASGLPMPAIYVIDDPAPNAFATGRDPAHGVVAVTTGLLERMNRDQLQGVIAHEMAHIGNRDTLVMAVAATTAGAIAILADIILRMTLFSRRGSSNPVALIIGIVGLALAPVAALMLRSAISRRREWLADATAVQITRNPAGLRSALEVLRDDSTVVRATSTAIAHVWIESPLAGGLGSLFSTHPPIEKRIAALRAMGG